MVGLEKSRIFPALLVLSGPAKCIYLKECQENIKQYRKKKIKQKQTHTTLFPKNMKHIS